MNPQDMEKTAFIAPDQGRIQTTASTAGTGFKFSDSCFYENEILTNRQFS